MILAERPHLIERPPRGFGEIDARELQLDVARLEARHLDGVGDQGVEAVGFLVHQSDVVALLRGAFEAAGKKGGGGHFNGRERGLEFVGDGVEQERLELVTLAGGFGAGGRFLGARFLESDGHQIRDALQGRIGKLDAGDSQTADGLRAEANGGDHAGGGRELGAGQSGGAKLLVEAGKLFGTATEDFAGGPIEKGDGTGREGPRDEGGELLRYRTLRVGQQDGAAEGVEALHFLLALLGFARAVLGMRGEAAGDDGGGEKGAQGDPILGLGDVECANGRKEKEIETQDGEDRAGDRFDQPPFRADEQDGDHIGESGGGGVDGHQTVQDQGGDGDP